jgi:glycosyltransferase involved in cell wall biosynthesis
MSKMIAVGGSCKLSSGSGINAYVKQLVDVLLAKGHNVIYIGPHDEHLESRANLQYFSAGSQDNAVDAVQRILELLRISEVDLIINNDNAYLQSAAPWVDCVFVAVGHMSKTSVATLACYNHRWLDYVVTISSDMQKTYVQKFGLDTAKVPIIYNGVNDPHAGRLPDKSTSKSIRIIYAGGNNLNKGARLLLETVKDPRWKDYAVELAWYGHMDSALGDRLAAIPGVTIHGRVGHAEILAQFSSADLFLLPSYKEGCPMSMLEAMSYGVIPIASDGHGAMERLVIHGQEGFICRLDNWVDDFYACMKVLVEKNALMRLLREGCYARFSTDFESSQLVKRLLALSEAPTCERNAKPKQLTILRWHRPLIKGSNRAPFIDRVCIKFGILRKARVISAQPRS